MVDIRGKGRRGEYGALKELRLLGFDGFRTPLSGAHPSMKGDIHLDNGSIIEVKVRRNGFIQLYSWLKYADALMVRQVPGGDWLFVIPTKKIKEFLNGKKD